MLQWNLTFDTSQWNTTNVHDDFEAALELWEIGVKVYIIKFYLWTFVLRQRPNRKAVSLSFLYFNYTVPVDNPNQLVLAMRGFGMGQEGWPMSKVHRLALKKFIIPGHIWCQTFEQIKMYCTGRWAHISTKLLHFFMTDLSTGALSVISTSHLTPYFCEMIGPPGALLSFPTEVLALFQCFMPSHVFHPGQT